MAGREPEERVRWPIVQQTWTHVAFLHWRADQRAVGERLPRPLAPQVIDGSAWVGVVAFLVGRFRVGGVPASLRPFPETNLRTYVQDPSGADGIWFFSLDVPSLFNIAGGRALAIPYYRARMAVQPTRANLVRYTSTRLARRAADHDITVETGDPLDPGQDELGESLAGRWRAYCHRGRLLQVPVEHEPWSLRAADAPRIEQGLLRAAGIETVDDRPLVHTAGSDVIHARLGPPRPAPTG